MRKLIRMDGPDMLTYEEKIAKTLCPEKIEGNQGKLTEKKAVDQQLITKTPAVEGQRLKGWIRTPGRVPTSDRPPL